MDKPLVSIVMPVYKTERFIETSIQSVLDQTYDNIELICVNDGTPDLAFDICKKYQIKYNKIKVLDHGENKGLEYTRNHGIKKALGKYILFLDSDDTIDKNMVNDMVYIAEKNSTDIVLSTYSMVINNKEQPIFSSEQTIEKADMCEFSNLLLDRIEWKILTCVGTKLYKADIIKKNNIIFDKKYKYNEDGGFIFSYLLIAKTISFINKPYYKYTIRDSGSIMSSYRKNLFSYLVKVNELLRQLFIKNGVYDRKKDLYYRKLFFIIIDSIKNEVKFGSRKTYLEVLRTVEDYEDSSDMKYFLKKTKLLGIQQKGVLFLIQYKMYRILYCIMKYKI